MRDEGTKDFKDLSDEESLELIERVCWPKDINEQFEIIYSYVGFDEEGC